MAIKIKITRTSSGSRRALPKQGLKFVLVMILFSFFIHFASYFNFSQFISRYKIDKEIKSPIKVNIVSKFPNPKDEEFKKQRIVEVPLEKTKKPEESKFKSFTDHSTEKETRVEVKLTEKRAQDAGQTAAQKSQSKPKEQEIKKNPKLSIESTGRLTMNPSKEKKEKYKALMPTSSELTRLLDAGYQEYLDENLAIGDRIDINTTEYRYMGYMTAMRKSIELVWNYPLVAAQKGMQGEVGLEFIIEKNGQTHRIRVIKSSGYKVLDDAIIEAIKLASPFAPLPEGFGKERIVITGMFRYILSSFLAGAH